MVAIRLGVGVAVVAAVVDGDVAVAAALLAIVLSAVRLVVGLGAAVPVVGVIFLWIIVIVVRSPSVRPHHFCVPWRFWSEQIFRNITYYVIRIVRGWFIIRLGIPRARVAIPEFPVRLVYLVRLVCRPVVVGVHVHPFLPHGYPTLKGIRRVGARFRVKNFSYSHWHRRREREVEYRKDEKDTDGYHIPSHFVGYYVMVIGCLCPLSSQGEFKSKESTKSRANGSGLEFRDGGGLVAN